MLDRSKENTMEMIGERPVAQADEQGTDIDSLVARAAHVDDPDFLAGIRTLEDAERKQGDIHCALRRAETEAERRRLSTLWHGIEKRVKATMLVASHCQDCRAELQGYWVEVCKLFEEHLPAEVKNEVMEITRRCFESIREPRG